MMTKLSFGGRDGICQSKVKGRYSSAVSSGRGAAWASWDNVGGRVEVSWGSWEERGDCMVGVLLAFVEVGLVFWDLVLRGFLGRVRVERSPDAIELEPELEASLVLGVSLLWDELLLRGVSRCEERLAGRDRMMLLLERRRNMIS